MKLLKFLPPDADRFCWPLDAAATNRPADKLAIGDVRTIENNLTVVAAEYNAMFILCTYSFALCR